MKTNTKQHPADLKANAKSHPPDVYKHRWEGEGKQTAKDRLEIGRALDYRMKAGYKLPRHSRNWK